MTANAQALNLDPIIAPEATSTPATDAPAQPVLVDASAPELTAAQVEAERAAKMEAEEAAYKAQTIVQAREYADSFISHIEDARAKATRLAKEKLMLRTAPKTTTWEALDKKIAKRVDSANDLRRELGKPELSEGEIAHIAKNVERDTRDNDTRKACVFAFATGGYRDFLAKVAAKKAQR